MPHKSAIAEGLAYLMKDARTNPLSTDGKKVFREMMNSSGMGVTQTLKYIGKKSGQRQLPKKSDDERSQERLEKLESEK
jgi:hypothetical protein